MEVESVMDCREFAERLDEILGRSLRDHERQSVDEHLRDCADCRRLLEALDGVGEPDGVPPDLAASILERTVGSACGSARDRLCAHVDGESGPVDKELVGLHLAACGDCAALARALVGLKTDLPRLAELQADRRFVDDVLAATVQHRRPSVRRLAPRLSDWAGLIRRPRLALEGAYLGTLLLAVLFWVPGSPLREFPDRALRLAARNPVAELEEPVARIEEHLSAGARSVWRAAGERTRWIWTGWAADLERISSASLERVRKDLGTLSDRLTSGTETEPVDEFRENADRAQGDEP
jgi:hypothetical protein